MAENTGVPSRRIILQRLALLVILGIAVHLILPEIATLENSLQVLSKMLFWAVWLAFIAQFISYLGSGYLLQKTLSIAHQAVRLGRSTLIVLGAASISMVAAGTLGSSAAIFRWTSREGSSLEGATLASLLPSLFNDLILVLFSIIGLAFLLFQHNLTQAQLVGFVITLIVLGLLVGISILAMNHRQRTTSAVLWITGIPARLRHKPLDHTSIRKGVDDLFTAWETLWHQQWRSLTLGAFLNITFDMLTLYFLFLASGENINIWVLISGYALPMLLGKMAFILPGGVGVVETSMTALYTGMGISSSTAVIAVLGYRLISFWIPSLAGFPIAGYLGRSKP